LRSRPLLVLPILSVVSLGNVHLDRALNPRERLDADHQNGHQDEEDDEEDGDEARCEDLVLLEETACGKSVGDGHNGRTRTGTVSDVGKGDSSVDDKVV